MNVILGTDHGGFQLKEEIKNWLMQNDHNVKDVGALSLELGDDYVDYANKAVKEAGSEDKIILFCRNGFGMCITANRFAGVRCGIAFEEEAVRRGRIDDDINCLSIPADYIKGEDVKKMIEIFLKTEFSGKERYKRRIVKIDNLNL